MNSPVASDKWLEFEPKPNNGFNIANPDAYTCMVQKYVNGHSQLWVKAYILDEGEIIPKSVFHLIFTSPFFFDGPLMWRGANFRIGESKEVLEVIRGIGWQYPDDQALQDFRLFVLVKNSSSYKVRILSTQAHITKELPKDFMH